jgi:hypothetical protein
MKIHELMTKIRYLDIVLPEFQREYVWELKQARELMVSLYRGFPTGSLLFWSTSDPPEIKNLSIPKDKLGTTMVILDGQQRLTTLYMLTLGDIPPYYTASDIKNDPRNLYFDLDSGDFLYYQVTRMQHSPNWVPVTACFSSTPPKVFGIAKHKLASGIDPSELAEKYNDNLNRLRTILDLDYPIQTVPPTAPLEDAIDVFDRVNSMGTKLTDAELTLTHITGKWPKARQAMKDKIQELEKKRFAFDLTFMVRSLVAVAHGRALFETIHKTAAEKVQADWERLTNILDYLVTNLPTHAHVHSTDDLNTTNVLVPLVAYLAQHNGKFESDRDMRHAIHWMYAASIWTRYSSQTDQKLDHDVSLIQRSTSPWQELVNAIIEQRGRIEVKPSDLEGRVIQHPLYRMMFVIAKSQGAVDWFNGSSLDSPQGLSYAVRSQHIFAPALLYTETGGYASDNHLHKKIVNEIANRVFLTEQSSGHVGPVEPSQYLATVEHNYPGALGKQFVPSDPSLWTIERFEDFLAARRKLIAEAINERMNELLVDLEPPKAQSLEELIALGENSVLEFKSSLQWDYREQRVNKELRKIVARAVAGFLNTEGGTLLIGVADNGNLVGLAPDIKTMSQGNQDGFELALRNVLDHHLGAEFSQYVHASFTGQDEYTVCVVKIERSPQPVFLTDGNATVFYIRSGNATKQLDVQATQNYISMHWEA